MDKLNLTAEEKKKLEDHLREDKEELNKLKRENDRIEKEKDKLKRRIKELEDEVMAKGKEKDDIESEKEREK